MSFDLAASLRRLKPEKRTGPLVRRPDEDLAFVGRDWSGGPPLLLDTSVYIDILQARLPEPVKKIVRRRQPHHSSVAIGELTHLFGRLDPSHPDTKAVLARVQGAVDAIPARRLSAPSIRAMAEAGIITGILARLTGLPRTDRQPLLNDATLFLQALEEGFTLVSGNIADMDLIQQLVPAGRVLLYRRT